MEQPNEMTTAIIQWWQAEGQNSCKEYKTEAYEYLCFKTPIPTSCSTHRDTVREYFIDTMRVNESIYETSNTIKGVALSLVQRKIQWKNLANHIILKVEERILKEETTLKDLSITQILEMLPDARDYILSLIKLHAYRIEMNEKKYGTS